MRSARWCPAGSWPAAAPGCPCSRRAWRWPTGGVLLSRLTATPGLAALAVAFVVFGIGGGLVNAPITHYTAVSGMPVSQAGVASGIASTSQPDRPVPRHRRHRLDTGREPGRVSRWSRFVAASHADWLLLAAMGGVVFVLALVTTSQWALGRRPAPPPRSALAIPALPSREPPGRYGCCPAIFRRAPGSVMVMSRWPVRMMPRRRQLDRARVTVARDAPVRLASSSWVSVIAVWSSLSAELEQEPGQPLRAAGHRAGAQHRLRVVPPPGDHPPVGAIRPVVRVQERAELLVRHDQRAHRADGLHGGVPVAGGLASTTSPTVSPRPRRARVSSCPSLVTPTILTQPSTSTNTWVFGSPSTHMTAPGG